MNDPERIGLILKKAIDNGFVLPEGDYTTADIFFDHSFAEAYFGLTDEWKTTKCTCGGVDFHIMHDGHREGCAKLSSKRGWMFHIQKLALSDDRITYLENAGIK